MKLKLAFFLFALIPAAFADPVTCTAGAASIPVFDPSSTSGTVGDYTLDCTGGTPDLPGQATPQNNFAAIMNVPVLNTGGWILTDGVSNFAGVLTLTNVVEFNGVPFDPPGTGNTIFTVENIVVDPNSEPPGFQFHEELAVTGDTAVFIGNQDQLVAVNAVPEPVASVLAGLGFVAVFLRRRRVSML
jgi:hypothetical protein